MSYHAKIVSCRQTTKRTHATACYGGQPSHTARFHKQQHHTHLIDDVVVVQVLDHDGRDGQQRRRLDTDVVLHSLEQGQLELPHLAGVTVNVGQDRR